MGNCLSPSPCGQKDQDGAQGRGGDMAWASIKVPGNRLSRADILSRAELKEGKFIVGGRLLAFGAMCFRGYYPDTPAKANQDVMGILGPEDMAENQALFGVFDGHGSTGDKCAEFARDALLRRLTDDLAGIEGKSADAMRKHMQSHMRTTFVDVNTSLHDSASVDDSLSGTTAIVAAIVGSNIWVANVGDSRAVLYTRKAEGLPVTTSASSADSASSVAQEPSSSSSSSSSSSLATGVTGVPVALSQDQTPYRRDERDRVKRCGARVMNMDQLEGLAPIHDNWDVILGEEIDDGGDPPRIWDPVENYPGTAFTRSIGDRLAESLGVCAEPEIEVHSLDSKDCKDLLLIIASDGVWEFITNQKAFEIVKDASTPLEAAQSLWQEAYKEWVSKEVRTDDITAIVVDLCGFYATDGLDEIHTTSPSASDTAAGPEAHTTGIPNRPARRGSTTVEVGHNRASANSI